MHIALDIENQGRSAVLGEKQPSREEADLHHYLGRSKYDPAEEIVVLKCCCNDDVRRKFLSSKLTTTLGGGVTRWKTDERTEGLRVPVVLALGGSCRALDQPQHVPRPDDNNAERFLRHSASWLGGMDNTLTLTPGPPSPSALSTRPSSSRPKAFEINSTLWDLRASPVFSSRLQRSRRERRCSLRSALHSS